MAEQEQIKMKPRDYALSRDMQPQLVYYHIRQGHLETESCSGGCGCTMIDVDMADKIFAKGVHGDEATVVQSST